MVLALWYTFRFAALTTSVPSLPPSPASFTIHTGVLCFQRYDDLPLFDLRSPQQEINLYKVKFDSATDIQSMVKNVEIKNAFQALPMGGGGAATTAVAAVAVGGGGGGGSDDVEEKEDGGGKRLRRQRSTTYQQYLVFIADNALIVEVSDGGGVAIRINNIVVEVATIFFNEAISFVPCFKYADSEDVILFASRNIKYVVLVVLL